MMFWHLKKPLWLGRDCSELDNSEMARAQTEASFWYANYPIQSHASSILFMSGPGTTPVGKKMAEIIQTSQY